MCEQKKRGERCKRKDDKTVNERSAEKRTDALGRSLVRQRTIKKKENMKMATIKQ